MSDQDLHRVYAPCDGITSRFKPEELVATCHRCNRFYARCCLHRHTTGIICHHARIIYTDGACSNNGKTAAVAGIGIAFGMRSGDTEDETPDQFSIPVDDRLDPGNRRTSQRAELLAALEGLRKFCDIDQERMADESETRKPEKSPSEVIITTDSEYVVKGMTEWLPSWKRNGLRKANGQRPSNLDLFRELDKEVEERERRHDCEIKFWHIDRAYNTIADRLAKTGAHAAANHVNKSF